jgi:hypothetical protein
MKAWQGIAREHHLEDARMAHVLADQLVNVAHAERPVPHAHRQAVHGNLGHEIGGHQIETDRIEVEPQLLASSSSNCPV